MNEDGQIPREGAEGEDAGLGAPIAELRSLLEPARPNMLQRLRQSIARRQSTSNLLDLSLPVFFGAFLEYLGMIFEFFSGPGQAQQKEKPWKTDSE